VVDYDPAELVLTVRPGTPLAQIEALVATQNQMLAFEPFDHGAIFGDQPGAATIGGVVAAGVAGSRRVTAGGARDHLLGFTAVSGRGEVFVAGAKVVKNVTGYDLPKLMAGSWGRLGAMTELTLKVLPRPRMTVTIVAKGLDPRAAHAAMACALGCNADVSAAGHLMRGITLLRVAGFAPSVEARCAALPHHLRDHCGLQRMDEAEAAPLWREAATGAGLAGHVLWRVHVAPARASDVIARLAPLAPAWSMDWGGGLLWLALDSHGTDVRQAAIAAGGEATLVRAPAEMRCVVPAFQPRAGGVAALEQRVRRAFDPAGVFETGRFLGEAHADQLRA
jgi:glycolate oxidase FAD binding subunit